MTTETLRVLLVDDEPMIREAMRDYLEEEGVVVVGEATNGEDGIRLAFELAPNVILMDMRMPGLDGIEATRLIKQRGSVARILLLTAYEDESLRSQALGAGADGYLVKGTLARDILDALVAMNARDVQ